MDENPITKRFIEVYNSQLATGAVKRDAVFARNAGTTPQNLNEILQGRSNPGLKIIQKIVENYGVSPVWILTGVGSMYEKQAEPAKPSGIIESLQEELTLLRAQIDINSKKIADHDNFINQLSEGTGVKLKAS